MTDRDNKTLGQQVYRYLHDRIMSGLLLPGAKLTLRGLAEETGTSVQPVREAVSRLAAEAALELTPNRSIRVPLLERDQIDELWSMRVLLEGEAAARFCRCAEPATVERLIELNESLRHAYAYKNWQQVHASGAELGPCPGQRRAICDEPDLLTFQRDLYRRLGWNSYLYGADADDQPGRSPRQPLHIGAV